MAGKRNDLTGRRYGALVVLGVAGSHASGLVWRVRCRCGVEKDVRGDKLVGGFTRSCGGKGCKGVTVERVAQWVDRLSEDERKFVAKSLRKKRVRRQS